MRAVKTFDVTEDEEESHVEQELGNWAALTHQAIVPLIKIVRLEFSLGAMMELMPGSLADYQRSHPSLDSQTVVQILLDVSSGLGYAYESQRLVHLDLKPANLLLTTNTTNSLQVKISDWGISRIISGDSKHADWFKDPLAWLKRQNDDKTQFCGGTLPYMAPERFSGEWQVGPQADIFSLGIIAIELLTGYLPTFAGEPGVAEIEKIVRSSEYYRRAQSLLQPFHKGLADLILRMVRPDPSKRIQGYHTLIKELEEH
ncbi:MAG: protein kinase domain-containing protein [Acidiferrobacteraceae bacterium]